MKFTVCTENPITVQKFLTEKGISKRLLKKLKRIPDGITKNGEHIRTIDSVFDGDIIILNLKDEKFLDANPDLKNSKIKIAYEDENLVVFNKPAGMPVHPSIKHQGDTLGNYFAYLYPDLTFRPINRLDRDTSGLCAIAKNAYTASVLQGNIEKTYYAVAEGITDEYGTINAPIAREKESIILRCIRQDGQKSITHYKRILCNENYSMLEIHLETGRTHQIRVHFAYIGHPLAGDEMYGGNHKVISRQALQCGQLSIKPPPESKIKPTEIKIEADDDILNIFR